MVGDEWRDLDSLRLMSSGISVVFVVSASVWLSPTQNMSVAQFSVSSSLMGWKFSFGRKLHDFEIG